MIAAGGQAAAWDLSLLDAALEAGLLPVVYGDVVFDHTLGGTILSTEDLFTHLVPRLRPTRILLAGLEAGVWADYPACTSLVPEITPANYAQLATALGGSHATDVTGGMASKVRLALDWAQSVPGLEVCIFSASAPGSLTTRLARRAVRYQDNRSTFYRQQLIPFHPYPLSPIPCTWYNTPMLHTREELDAFEDRLLAPYGLRSKNTKRPRIPG